MGDVVAWQTLHDHPQLGFAAADLARSVESGTSMVQGLRHHAAAAREVRRSELQVLARAVGVPTAVAMMATHTGALDTASSPPASKPSGAWFLHVMHSHQKEGIFRRVDPSLLVRQAFRRAGEPRSGFVGQ